MKKISRFAALFLVIWELLAFFIEGRQGQATCTQIQMPNIAETTENIVEAQQGSSPWHAAIYKLENGKYNNICCGTIISSTIVLTAAKCVFNATKRAAADPLFFKVVVGRLTYKLDKSDPFAQERKVLSIHMKDTYQGDISSYGQNIALLALRDLIIMNKFVQPACIDWSGKANIPRLIRASGWGLKGDGRYSDNLLEVGMTHLPRAPCFKNFTKATFLRFINYDKFCLFTKYGRKEGDTGTGIVVKSKGTFYIQGVLSTSVAPELLLATNISRYLPWIQEKMNTIREWCSDGFECSSNQCIDEKQKCDGVVHCSNGLDEDETVCDTEYDLRNTCILKNQTATYEIIDCNHDANKCIRKPLSRVPANTKVRVKCGLGYAPPDGKAHIAVCISKTWFPEEPQCIKISCTYKGEDTNCNNVMNPGTIAIYKCNRHYRMKDPFAFSGTTRCLPSAEWSEQLPKCVPECGHANKNDDALPTVAGGNDTVYGKYPWHVGIYQKFSHNSSYVNICGGTIVSPHMILTAAHCLYDKTTKKLFDINSMAVAAGKFKRDWYNAEPYQQSTPVKEYIIPDTFTGFVNRYEHDIALLDIDTPFVLTDFVLPVCLDWAKNGIYPPNAKGTIIGWGLNENNTYSENLQEISLPVTNIVPCRAQFEFFIAFLTYDKFCAIYKNGFGGARSGDSGGSMTFSRGDIYFIHGVVSVKPTRDDRFGAMTNVTEHLDWIKQQLKSHSRFN